LQWFVTNLGLNTVELEASFCCFLFSKVAKPWVRKRSNPFISHRFRFNEKLFQRRLKFRDRFIPLNTNVYFYLFQLHSRTIPESAFTKKEFATATGLQKTFALEVRN
jgi:uncharacterized protein YecE (DUF72 family)